MSRPVWWLHLEPTFQDAKYEWFAARRFFQDAGWETSAGYSARIGDGLFKIVATGTDGHGLEGTRPTRLTASHRWADLAPWPLVEGVLRLCAMNKIKLEVLDSLSSLLASEPQQLVLPNQQWPLFSRTTE